MIYKTESTVRYNAIENQVQLCTVNGGTSGWHVLIDRYYQGTGIRLKDVWVGHINRSAS
jgi:hypothetical protein